MELTELYIEARYPSIIFFEELKNKKLKKTIANKTNV